MRDGWPEVEPCTGAKVLRWFDVGRLMQYSHTANFFPPQITSEAERQWETSLTDLIRPLPPLVAVAEELRARLRALLDGT